MKVLPTFLSVLTLSLAAATDGIERPRTAPDPATLFKDYWQWTAAPKVTNPTTADPLKIVRGYWANSQTEQ